METNGKQKYHNLWFLQINERPLHLLYFLKTAPTEQVKAQYGEVNQHVWSNIEMQWVDFVRNEHTEEYISDLSKRVLAIHEVLKPITKLVFPQWIMDRYKEALDQHIRGEWMSSISLCGDIVEFIVYEFWRAYMEDIPSDRRKTPSDSTENNLHTLNDFDVKGEDHKIVGKEDFERLARVRKLRDIHVHYRLRNGLLSEYREHLKSDNVEALTKLAEFFAEANMMSKYSKYLQYADKEQAAINKIAK